MPVPSTMMVLSETSVLTAGGARGLDAGVHHRQRADGNHEIGFVTLDDLLQGGGDEPLLAVAAVVGADDKLVGVVPELVLPEHEVLGPEPHDRRGAVAGFLERAKLRVNRGDAEAAADQHHMARLSDVLRQAERAGEIRKHVASAVFVAHLARRLAERLHDNRDRAALAVVVGDRQRNALAPLVKAQHDEVTGLRRLGHVWGVDLPQKGHIRKSFASHNRIHTSPSSSSTSQGALHQIPRLPSALLKARKAANSRLLGWCVIPFAAGAVPRKLSNCHANTG